MNKYHRHKDTYQPRNITTTSSEGHLHSYPRKKLSSIVYSTVRSSDVL